MLLGEQRVYIQLLSKVQLLLHLVAMDLTYKLTYTLQVTLHARWRPSLRFDLRPAWKMFGFSSRLLATNVLTTCNNQLIQVLMGHFFPPTQVGLYSQANKWNTMGYSTLSGMVGNVGQPVLARTEGGEERRVRVFRKLLRFTAFCSFPAMLGLAVIAPEFISLTIGEKWARETCYVYPGPIQYWGPTEVCDKPTITLELEQQK